MRSAARSSLTMRSTEIANSVGALRGDAVKYDRAVNRDSPASERGFDETTMHRYPAAPSDRTTASALRSLPSVITAVRSFTFGVNRGGARGIRPGSFLHRH